MMEGSELARSNDALSKLVVGGMMLWVEMPEQRDGQAVFEAALQQRIRVVPGTLFSNSQCHRHFLRMGCGSPLTRESEQALKRVGQLRAEG